MCWTLNDAKPGKEFAKSNENSETPAIMLKIQMLEQIVTSDSVAEQQQDEREQQQQQQQRQDQVSRSPLNASPQREGLVQILSFFLINSYLSSNSNCQF